MDLTPHKGSQYHELSIGQPYFSHYVSVCPSSIPPFFATTLHSILLHLNITSEHDTDAVLSVLHLIIPPFYLAKYVIHYIQTRKVNNPKSFHPIMIFLCQAPTCFQTIEFHAALSSQLLTCSDCQTHQVQCFYCNRSTIINGPTDHERSYKARMFRNNHRQCCTKSSTHHHPGDNIGTN